MEQLLDDYLSCQLIRRGQLVSGTIIRARPTEVIIDIGAKCEGIVLERDLNMLSEKERERIQVGEEIMAYVLSTEDSGENIILSLSKAQIARDWRRAKGLFESQDIVEREIVDCNKGGVIVHLGRVRGFVPGSQLDAAHVALQQNDGENPNERWRALVGQSVKLKVIEVDQRRNRLIMSERAALRDWRKHQREKLLTELAEGDVRPGRVINLADFGAFVDLGGIDGLVHISELSWKRVSHPKEVVQVGDEVEVYVLSVDRERQRIGLSLKKLQPDPWISVEERYREGQLIEGVITRLTKWGAFARIVEDEAIEGLIHISEMADRSITHPRDVVQPGQTVTLRVISVDADNHRMGLSLKQVDQEMFIEQDWKSALTEADDEQGPMSAALADAMEDLDSDEQASWQ
jgi:small subunit ribosomal protein S1